MSVLRIFTEIIQKISHVNRWRYGDLGLARQWAVLQERRNMTPRRKFQGGVFSSTCEVMVITTA